MITSNMFIQKINLTFSDTKYKKWYISLMSNAILRVNYTQSAHKNQALKHLTTIERHHICPRSIFPEHKNDKTNLAYLSPREHFLAHLLLYKMAKIDSKFVRPMALALSKMRQNNNYQSRVLNSNQYNVARNAAIDANKHRHYKTGYKQSKETVTKRIASYHKNYKGHSDETRKKISLSAKGRIVSEDTRKKISGPRPHITPWNKGHRYSEEERKKFGNSGSSHPLYGTNRSKETKSKLSSARKGRYTGSENGMYGISHDPSSILLMTINKIKPRIKNIQYDLTLDTWKMFVAEVICYASNHDKKTVCNRYGISPYILKNIIQKK